MENRQNVPGGLPTSWAAFQAQEQAQAQATSVKGQEFYKVLILSLRCFNQLFFLKTLTLLFMLLPNAELWRYMRRRLLRYR